MRLSNEIWFNRPLGKKNILLIFLFVLFILFRETTWNFYNREVVDHVLNKIEAHWLIDITFILLSLTLLIYTVHLVLISKRIANNFFFFFLFIFLLFFYCRIFADVYEFESYFWFSSLKYIDILFLIFGCLLLLKVWNWLNEFKKPYYFKSPFFIDYPISSSSEDVYKRAEFAELLAEKIQSELENKNAGALAIGINGAWGSGKTSFSNLVREKIQFENRIVIEFNPWRSSSPEKIIEDFFELLISELEKDDPGLSKVLNKYASTLTKIDENIITKSVESISEYIFSSPNKNESYDRINNAVAKLKKQIIIFIDDLDRLDIKETVEVLRLIRNTANFNAVVYLVSYDKGYVLEAVKEFNPYNHRAFLEKIFQFEFLLPSFDNAILRNELKGLLTNNLIPKDDPIINAAVDYAGSSGKNLTARVLKSKRDILRFSNAFLFEIKGIKEEVNFIDFYLIHLLKLKFTAVYKFLADHFELFFITEKGEIRLRTVKEKGLNEDLLSMLSLLDESRRPAKDEDEKQTLFEEYVRGNTSEGYTDLEKDIILELVNELMREKDYRVSSTSKDFKSFVYSKNFNTYFNIRLLETNFTAKEFEEFRYDDYEKYREVIFKWIEKGRISDVQERLIKIVDFSTKKEWESHWKILIEIAKYQYKVSGVYGINYREIIDVLTFPDNPKGTGHTFFDNREAYISYLRSIFENAPEPYVIEGNILTSALTPYANLPFTDEEIEKQLLEYFKKYCNDHKEITNEFRELHKNAVRKSDTYGRNFEFQDEAQTLFKEHFLEYITGSQLAGFIKHTEPEQDYFNINYEWVKTFFEEPVYENLENYLERAEHIKAEKDHYDEFMEFYDKFRKNNYEPVEFVFKHLQPSLWSGGTKSNPRR